LEGIGFQSRYAIASFFLNKLHCQNIFEIGGCKTPINNFLHHQTTSIVSVYPATRSFYQEIPFVLNIPIPVQDYTFSGSEDSLVILGLDIIIHDIFATIIKRPHFKTLIL
jgi:hypothetical protein